MPLVIHDQFVELREIFSGRQPQPAASFAFTSSDTLQFRLRLTLGAAPYALVGAVTVVLYDEDYQVLAELPFVVGDAEWSDENPAIGWLGFSILGDNSAFAALATAKDHFFYWRLLGRFGGDVDLTAATGVILYTKRIESASIPTQPDVVPIVRDYDNFTQAATQAGLSAFRVGDYVMLRGVPSIYAAQYGIWKVVRGTGTDPGLDYQIAVNLGGGGPTAAQAQDVSYSNVDFPLLDNVAVALDQALAGGGPSGPVASSDVTFTPTGGILATNVQTALAEVDAEKAAFGSMSCGGVTVPATATVSMGGLLNVASVDVNINETSDFSGPFKRFTVAPLVNFPLTENVYYYVTVIWNSGNPIYDVTTNNNIINHSNRLAVCQAIWEKIGAINEGHVFQVGAYGLGLANKIGHRLIHTERFGWESGLMLGESSGRVITATAGRLWYDGEEINLGDLSTSANNYHLYYHSAYNVWTAINRSVYSNTEYDDNTGGLKTVGPSKYSVSWVYRSVADDIDTFVLLGDHDYKLSEAQASQPPASIPTVIAKQSILIGRIIVLSGATTATQIDTAFATVLSSSGVIAHSDTTGRDVTGQHPAAAIAFTPVGSIAATDVQAAIAEVNTEAVHLAGPETITGDKTFSNQIVSTLAIGTAPLAVTSTTVNTNLNADLLDGLHATAFALVGAAGAVNGTKYVADYGVVGDGVADDTTAIQAAIAATPAGWRLQFDGSKTYRVSSLGTITKSICIDGAGCRIIADVTDVGTAGHPLFCFYGAKTLPYACNAVVVGSPSITLTVAADAANFTAGDMVSIYSTDAVPLWDGSGTSQVEKQEVNSVLSSNVGTGVVVLMYPVTNAMTLVTISRVTPVDGASVKNFGNITETYSGTAGTAAFGPNAPNIVDFMYCRNCTVDNVRVRGYEMTAISIAYSESMFVSSCLGAGAYNPSVGGEGTVVKCVTCRHVLISKCKGEDVRHLVDWVGCLDSASEFNNCTQDPTAAAVTAAYLTHGFLSKRIQSFSDSAVNARGWYIGNSGFATDSHIQVIGFRQQGTDTTQDLIGITIWNGVTNVEIVSADIETRNDCIHIGGAARDISIQGGMFRNVHPSSYSGIALWDATNYPSNVSITNADVSCSNQGIYFEFQGHLTIRNCTVKAPKCINGSNSVAGTSLVIESNIVTRTAGSGDYAISVGAGGDFAPTSCYRVVDNHVIGDSSPNAIGVRLATHMLVRRNRAPGNSSTITLIGSGITKDQISLAGGAVDDNNNSGNDTAPPVIGVSGANTSNRLFEWRTNGVARWAMSCGLTGAGEPLALACYSNAGVWLDNPLYFERSITGLVQFGSGTTRKFVFGTAAMSGNERFRFAGGSTPSTTVATDVLIGNGTLDAGTGLKIAGVSVATSLLDRVLKAGDTMTGSLTLSGTAQFVSSVALGTAPLAVTSTTVNTNLNADLLDGLHAAAFARTADVVLSMRYSWTVTS